MLYKNTPKTHFFVFLKMKIFNRAERYTLFALCGSIGPCATIFDFSSVLQHSKSALYADDFKFIGDVSTPQDRRLMQADLDAVARWSADNRLPISFQKSFALHYGKSNIKQQYSVHGSVIKSTSSCADLGVLRCDDFSYDQHAHSRCSTENLAPQRDDS